VRFTVITLLRGAPWYDLVHETVMHCSRSSQSLPRPNGGVSSFTAAQLWWSAVAPEAE